jgi:SagB-type dehydrogenase family enzyme
LYWRHDTWILQNYATSAIAEADPLICRLLDFCGEWKTVDEIRAGLALGPSALLPKLVRRLVTRSFLQQSSRPEDQRERAMTTLDAWNPEAGFFHNATKRVRFWPAHEAKWRAREQSRRSPMPAPVKTYRGFPVVELPAPDGDGAFTRVVRERRTWRRFSSAPVTLVELATVLGLSVGVQKWVRIAGRDLALKTSPSGGARHPIEAYVVVRRVRGLAAGTYHYDAGRHVLARLSKVPPLARVKAYLPSSGHFAHAPVLVLLTAVLERQLWRYPYSRAYRAALIEAGHVCQTFCLAATSLRLAPFSVMGLADSVIEEDLGINGITETVLYAAGVGRPPRGVSWAPLTKGTLKARSNPSLS